MGAVAGAAAAQRAARAVPAPIVGQATRRKLERVGIQLYTVRGEMRRDMPGTLARLAAMGYKDVEFAGYFGRSSAEVRRLLADTGLAAPSTHVGYDPAGWDRALDDAIEKGHRWVTVPSLPPPRPTTLDDWRAIADAFTRAGERAAARGLSFAFHNHDAEFQRVDGQVPFDILLARTNPRFVSFQMDVFWLTRGGGDARAYIRAHPTRFVMLHVKDSSGPPAHDQVDLGAGTIDFAGILAEDATLRHVVQHAFVEHDQPTDPMAFARSAYEYLSRLEF